MPTNPQISIQEILNRVLDITNNRLIVETSANASTQQPPFVSEQEVWNRVYDATNNVLNIN